MVILFLCHKSLILLLFLEDEKLELQLTTPLLWACRLHLVSKPGMNLTYLLVNSIWWALSDSNRGLPRYERGALTNWAKSPNNLSVVARADNFAPTISITMLFSNTFFLPLWRAHADRWVSDSTTWQADNNCNNKSVFHCLSIWKCSPKGNRTPVFAVKGRHPNR